MNIFLKAYTAINLGDDLFIREICNRYKKHLFHLVAKKQYIDIFKNIPNIIVHECNIKSDEHQLSLEINSKCDIFVYIGGSIFIEPETNFEQRLDSLVELIQCNKNFYIIGANFGPYKTKEYYEYIKNKVIANSKGVCFRDKYSYTLFKDMDNVYYAPDVIFGLKIKPELPKKEIGISVIHHLDRKNLKQNYSKYLIKMQEIVEYFQLNQYTVNLFSFCNYEKDLEAIQKYLDFPDVNIIEYNGNIDTYLAKLNEQEYIIATRFHATILGLTLNKKVLPICYSEKTVNAIKDLNANLVYYTFEDIDKLDVKDIINIKNNYNLNKQKKQSKKQFQFLDKII